MIVLGESAPEPEPPDDGVRKAMGALVEAAAASVETYTPSQLRRMLSESLESYHGKRNLAASGEPSGSEQSANGRIFVVQKHKADRAGLHWDFRLEIGGALWSWAIPKGPSMDPADRRLAIWTENHPMDYAKFQGSIPQGNYGSGTVEIWDSGTWIPDGDPEERLGEGKLEFSLDGGRLKGKFALVRWARAADQPSQWMLVKMRDRYAVPGATANRLEEASELTSPWKPIWPGITKADLAAYWEAVAGRALPFIARRPLAVVRAPDGIAGEVFFQKNGRGGLPPEIREGRSQGGPYLSIEGEEGLAAMAQISAVEIHAWLAPESDTSRPDRLVFDLDPGDGVHFSRVLAAARELRQRLGVAGHRAFCSTTGGRGLHVVVPLVPAAAWDDSLAFARSMAGLMAQSMPDLYTTSPRLEGRAGLILLDVMRNVRGATSVAPYSPRALPRAPVAAPLAWEEVGPGLDPYAFTIHTMPRLIAAGRDPWADFASASRPLSGSQGG